MPQVKRAKIDESKFNDAIELPYSLRRMDFISAMQDVYDFFSDVNDNLTGRGLQRLDDMLRPAAMSGMLSDMITDSLANHSRALTPNLYHNGHPDLILKGRYPQDRVQSGREGVEVKATRKPGGAVDTHGARDQTLCVWVYEVDNNRDKSVYEREPLRFREIYINEVTLDDFRHNPRGSLGTKTSTLHKEGLTKFREGWVYLDKGTGGHSAWRG
ncbi:hypothetical protein [Nocardia cyriacigeorgica]|uniref:hypothetical protein n=1 Tax=Nocardia cyriacigeorgica TaxID=135487 RepID=UPI002456BEA8|nr:hypothetical protein [Nocardia cyriacigeorgica]